MPSYKVACQSKIHVDMLNVDFKEKMYVVMYFVM